MCHRRLWLLGVSSAFLIGGALGLRATLTAPARVDGGPVRGTAPPLAPTADEWAVIRKLRDIGLQGRVPDAGAAIKALSHAKMQVRFAALWTLARLGSGAALPAVDRCAQAGGEYWGDSLYARVVAAQIRVVEPGAAKDVAALRAQMSNLVERVGLSPSEVATVLRRGERGGDNTKLAPARWRARQVADMALAAADHGLSNAATASPLDLSLDPRANIKAELSRRANRSQRIAWTIDELASHRVQQADDDLLVQALVNEGDDAVAPIAAQLEAMRRSVGTYTQAPFCLLFRALEGIGGDAAAKEVASFLDYAGNAWVKTYAERSHANLSQIFRHDWAVPF